MQDEPFSEEESSTSKSQLKREMHERQALGESLINLKAPQLDELALPDTLVSALLEAPRIKQKNARKRHLNYIGKLMREIDTERIEDQLKLMEERSHATKKQTPVIEKWVNDFIQGDETIFQTFISRHPQCDIQHLRQLIRNAKRESSLAESTRKTTCRKKLFSEIQKIRQQTI